jgi:hypothetical protein
MKTTVIPIVASDHAQSAHPHEHAHDEHTAQAGAAALRIPLTRRELLKGSGVLMGTLAFSSVLATLAPSRSWALELQGLDTHQGDVILAFTRQLYPHPTLDNAVYALVVKDLDTKAKADPAVRQQLTDGVKQLDAKAGSNWLTRAPAAQAKTSRRSRDCRSSTRCAARPWSRCTATRWRMRISATAHRPATAAI